MYYHDSYFNLNGTAWFSAVGTNTYPMGNSKQ